MKWPSAASTGDLVVTRGDLPGERWFVLHSHGQPQLVYPSYDEAEVQARLYAERAGARAWYVDGGRLRLIAGHHGTQRPPTEREPGEREREAGPRPQRRD